MLIEILNAFSKLKYHNTMQTFENNGKGFCTKPETFHFCQVNFQIEKHWLIRHLNKNESTSEFVVEI